MPFDISPERIANEEVEITTNDSGQLVLTDVVNNETLTVDQSNAISELAAQADVDNLDATVSTIESDVGSLETQTSGLSSDGTEADLTALHTGYAESDEVQTEYQSQSGISSHANNKLQGQRRTAIPKFERIDDNPIFSHEDADWVTSDEIHWASVLPTDDLADPQGAYYLYYSPHDQDGVGLAYADHPEGPWTDDGQLPVLETKHGGESSAFYNEETDEVWLYADRGNANLTLHRSPDGVSNWTDDGDVFSTTGAGHTGYPNILRTPAGVYDTTWQKYGGESARPILRYSPDGRNDWEWIQTSFNGDEPTGSTDGSGEFYHDGYTLLPYLNGYLAFWSHRDKPNGQFNIYHGWTTDGVRINDWGLLLEGGGQTWENNKIAEPKPLWHGNTLYLFYCGDMGGGTSEFGLAKADFSEVRV